MATAREIPASDKGNYTLILELNTSQSITIGRFGVFDFPVGWYVYTGSAFGPGGLSGRLKHHLSPVERPHWHIDYLRVAAPCREVWTLASKTNAEHHWARILATMPGASIPVARFGASDCRCAAHLIHVPQRPDFELFSQLTSALLQCWQID